MQIQIPYDPATNPLNNNEWSFPLLEIIHIVGFMIYTYIAGKRSPKAQKLTIRKPEPISNVV